jgi:hypothetical protein
MRDSAFTWRGVSRRWYSLTVWGHVARTHGAAWGEGTEDEAVGGVLRDRGRIVVLYTNASF